jgi:hypothetical protein
VCGHYAVSTGKEGELEDGVVGRPNSERPPLHRCLHDWLGYPAYSCCWDGAPCYVPPRLAVPCRGEFGVLELDVVITVRCVVCHCQLFGFASFLHSACPAPASTLVGHKSVMSSALQFTLCPLTAPQLNACA